MSLVSPGSEVTIIDESQYASAAQNTVPYILLATAENKLDAAGSSIASGTLSANADNVYLITSQRELVNTFGSPTFYSTASGTPIHGSELNEYGLMAAYSVLGATNRAYVQRVDVNLAQLTATNVRPIGKANDDTFWMDIANTTAGLFVWDQTSNRYSVIAATYITNVDDLVGGTADGAPLASVGSIGDYAIVVANANNPVYLKNSSNAWVLIGSDLWKAGIPTVTGTLSNPTVTALNSIVINGIDIPATGGDLDSYVADINADLSPILTFVTASNVDGRLVLYVSDSNSAVGSADVSVTIAAGTGTLLADLGITAGTYLAPIVAHENHINIPRWRVTDIGTTRPSGSIWHKTTAVNDGANIIIRRYDATADTWTEEDAPLYANDETANRYLDPGYGGKLIAANSVYAQYDVNNNDTGTFKVFTRALGETAVVGTNPASGMTFAGPYTVQASAVGSATLTSYVVTLAGTAATDFVTAVSAANIPGVTASVTTAGYVQLTHSNGGVIVIDGTLGSVLGISDVTNNVRLADSLVGTTDLILSNWNALSYVVSQVEPGQDPVDGTLWFYPDVDDIDIMVHNGTTWVGYQTLVSDVRGYDLTATNPTGPIVSVTAPTTQSDGSALAYGDLWINSSDLENYPVISRWEEITENVSGWVQINTADQTTTDGILFADARWGTAGDIDPVADELPLITDLLLSSYLDLDAPDPALYPVGMLLWNTRRSGNNVKSYQVNYLNSTDFNGVEPAETSTWVSASGHRDDGVAYFGRHAQRRIVVAAMKSAIDTNSSIREEQRAFNLLACPGYPELIPNMVALNNERANTSFIVGDSPLRLANTSNAITEWATNNSGVGTVTGDGLQANDEYLGVFYPSGKTNDLNGNTIVVPPSHMILRTIIHSDEQSYPWLAPAGTRRGNIDNASAIGYLDSATGEFISMNTRQGIRDVLYTNNVNPITFIEGAGFVNYGNKTTKSGSTLSRINVSRLASYIRMQLNQIGKQFIFEPNDKLTRDEFKGQIERMLNDLVAKRGLYAYVVVCDQSNNTPLRIDRNELWADVAISPVKAGEYIYIPVRIVNTGDI